MSTYGWGQATEPHSDNLWAIRLPDGIVYRPTYEKPVPMPNTMTQPKTNCKHQTARLLHACFPTHNAHRNHTLNRRFAKTPIPPPKLNSSFNSPFRTRMTPKWCALCTHDWYMHPHHATPNLPIIIMVWYITKISTYPHCHIHAWEHGGVRACTLCMILIA